MAHFMNHQGTKISKSIQPLPKGTPMTIGVYGAAGLKVGPNDPSMALMQPQGSDRNNNYWYVITGLRTGQVMIEAKQGSAVWDFFQLAVGPSAAGVPATLLNALSGSVGAGGRNVATDVLTVKSLLATKMQQGFAMPPFAVNSDGNDPVFHEAIRIFQREVLSLRGDGLVAPGGVTLQALQAKDLGVLTTPIDPKWQRDQPSPTTMKRLLQRYFPIIKKYDIYAPRNMRSGTTISPHAYGRAIDIYLNANVPQEKAVGDMLFESIRVNADELKLGVVIWNRWSYGNKWKRLEPYKGVDPHNTHVHADWSEANSQQTAWPGFEAELRRNAGQ